MNRSFSSVIGLFVLALAALVAVTATESADLSLAKQRKLDCSNSKVWCQSASSALACNTSDFCMKAVWSKQRTRPISASVCEDCVQLMDTLKSELALNSSKQYLGQVLDVLCWSMMAQKAWCELVLHASFDKIYSMLNDSVQSADICNSLPFCVSNVQHDVVHVPSGKRVASSCPKCFDFIESAKNRFASQPVDIKRSVFARLIPRLCVLTYGNQDFCFSKHFSSEQLDIMSDLVEDHVLDKEMCSYTSLCLDGRGETSVELDRKFLSGGQKSSTECDMCKIIFRNVQQLLVTNSTFEKFKENAEKLCSKVVKNSEICDKDLDKYLNVVYSTLKEPSFPDLICTIMDVCVTAAYPNPYISSDIETEPRLDSLHRNEIYFGDRMDETDEERLRKLYWCHFVAFIKERIDMGRDNQGVKDDFSSLCGKIPHLKTCRSFYEKQLDSFIVLVRSNDIKSKSCSEALPMSLPDADADADQHSVVDSKQDCLICHLLMSRLQKMLSKNKTIDKFEMYLKKACQMVEEKKLEDECDRFVDAYGDKMIQMLSGKFSPKYICKELNICSAVTMDEFRKKVDDCSVCAQSTKALSEHMSDRLINVSDATQLMAVCNDIPQKSVVDPCKRMMKSFGKSFVRLTQNKLSPLDICYQTGLCAKSASQRPSECFNDYSYTYQCAQNALKCDNVRQFMLHHEIVVVD